MSSSALPTLENVTRDVNELAQQGVFIHRRVAEQLLDAGCPLWKTEKDKTAFITANPGDRAAAIAAGLKMYDAQRGGTPATAQAPAQQAAPVQEQAPAPAQAAAPGKRAPRTTNGAAAAAANGAATQQNGAASAPATSADVGGVAALLIAIKGLDTNLGNLVQALEGQAKAQAGLTSSVGGAQTSLNDLKGMVAGVIAVQRVQLGLLCLFGAQVLGAPMEAFLETALSDADKALDLVEAMGEEAAPGKG